MRRTGAQHHLERAPCRDQLPLRRQPGGARHRRAPDQEHPPAEHGHAGHGAQRPGSRRRGIRHRRRHLARPAGDRLCQIGRHRDGLGQRQPDRHPRAVLGGDRPDRQDPDPSGGAVLVGGQALHPSPRQHLAAALSAAAPADVGGDQRSRRHRRARPARHGQHHGDARGRRDQARLGRLSRRARRGRAVEADRPTASAIRPLSMSATPTRKACGSAASCCGSSTPA